MQDDMEGYDASSFFKISFGGITLRLIFGVYVGNRVGCITKLTNNVTPGDKGILK